LKYVITSKANSPSLVKTVPWIEPKDLSPFDVFRGSHDNELNDFKEISGKPAEASVSRMLFRYIFYRLYGEGSKDKTKCED
jgi:hypothetical protein